MPLASLVRPSISLGTLKAVLKREGLDVAVLYANLWYAEFIGAQYQGTLLTPRTEECLVDWLFAKAAFPDLERDDDAFLGMLLTNNPDLLKRHPGEPAEVLLNLREKSPPFIEWAAKEVLARKPRVVGCTSTFQQHVASLALLRQIKKLDPSIVTMMGGANCESVMGKTTHEHFRWVDFVVSGEADDTITDLCQKALLHGPKIPAKDVPPAVYAPVHRILGYPTAPTLDGFPRGTMRSLEALPPPDYDDYFFREIHAFVYRNDLRPGIPVETSRGCWWGQKQHCTFCGLNGGGMKFRAKSPKQAIAEIDGLVDRYGSARISTVDNIIDMNYFDSVLPHFIESERKLNIFFETKANLKRSHVERFQRAGVHWIQPGIESMHTDMLKLMRKGVSAYQNVRLLKWCREYGIFTFWSVLAGFPGEKDEWYQEMSAWLPLIEHFQPGNFCQLRFDRFSPYFNSPQEFGLNLRPTRQYEHVYPLSGRALEDQVYFFTDPEHALFPQMATRPGLAAVAQQLADWPERWKQRPTLEYVNEGTEPRVLDTRSCAAEKHVTIDATDRDLLAACDAGASKATLLRAKSALSEHELTGRLTSLAQKKLLLALDGKYLSLVLDSPKPGPPMLEFPGGTFLWKPPKEPDTQKPVDAPLTAEPG